MIQPADEAAPRHADDSGGLLDAGVPFVKVALFRVNEYALDLDYVLSDIRAVNPHHAGLIRGHLQRVGPVSWTARKQGPFLP